MIGSILSNLLLVMGSSFLLGGLVNMKDALGNGIEQAFTSAMAQNNMPLVSAVSRLNDHSRYCEQPPRAQSS
jgi:Ca2+:H+ antiporter